MLFLWTKSVVYYIKMKPRRSESCKCWVSTTSLGYTRSRINILTNRQRIADLLWSTILGGFVSYRFRTFVIWYNQVLSSQSVAFHLNERYFKAGKSCAPTGFHLACPTGSRLKNLSLSRGLLMVLTVEAAGTPKTPAHHQTTWRNFVIKTAVCMQYVGPIWEL